MRQTATTSSLMRRAGFTLVELAIVLVIIGLLIGGVLVGQDLLRSATIGATIRDVEKFNAAATAFRTKYGALPGDISAVNAVTFNLNVTANDTARNGQRGLGNGDGQIEGGAADATDLDGETALFWTDLNQAGLIAGVGSTYVSTSALDSITAASPVLAGEFLPRAKISYASTIHVYSSNGRNQFAIGAMTIAAGVVTGNANSTSAGITALEAFSIDSKMDDGLPLTGSVIALPDGPLSSTLTTIVPVAPAVNVCVGNTSTPETYYTGLDYLDSPSCFLAVRASF